MQIKYAANIFQSPDITSDLTGLIKKGINYVKLTLSITQLSRLANVRAK